LIFLFQLVEALLRSLLLFGFTSTAPKHLVEESHDGFLSFQTITGGNIRGSFAEMIALKRRVLR
jgi:hypothetical protein